MDIEALRRWEDYSRARDEMMERTDTAASPWYLVESEVKKHARLNMMAHLLDSIPYREVERRRVSLPKKPVVTGLYERPDRSLYRYVDDYAATLLGDA
jgi:hypothetical protein